jgi:hypothetical protein
MTDQERAEQEAIDQYEVLSKTSRLLDDKNLDPGNAERQLGRSLPHEVVERRLTRINPNIKFFPSVSSKGVFNPHKRVVKFLEPTGELADVCICEAGMVPENSLMSYRYEVTLTRAALSNSFVLDRKDLPKTEVFEPYQDETGQWWTGDVQWDPDVLLPGQVVKKIPWNEIKRGYRTLGAILIRRAIITVDEFEKEFGTQNTAAWAAVSGRRKKETPW